MCLNRIIFPAPIQPEAEMPGTFETLMEVPMETLFSNPVAVVATPQSERLTEEPDGQGIPEEEGNTRGEKSKVL